MSPLDPKNVSDDVKQLNPELFNVTTTSRKKHKYNAQQVTSDDIKFASRRESQRYHELKQLEQAGAISALKLQPRYKLIEPFVDAHGVKHRGIDYIADFEYQDEHGQTVVEDVKGFETPVFKIKRKLFCFFHSKRYKLKVVK